MKNLPTNIKIILGIIGLLIVISITNKAYDTTVDLYNTSKELELDYNKITQEQVSNYDGYYLAFQDKQTNANINKETFVITECSQKKMQKTP